MPAKEADVIVLDEEDDATSLSGCLAVANSSGSNTDHHENNSPHLDLKPYPATSVQPANNLKPAYFANSSWSFATPSAAHTKSATPSKPTSGSYTTPGPGFGNSASTTPTSNTSSSMTQGPGPGPGPVSRPTMMELTDDDDFADEESLALWMAQDAEDEMRRSSLTSSDAMPATPRRSSTVIPRNLPITSPCVRLDSYTHNGILLAEKVFVELRDKDFLRIVDIIQNTSTSAVTLRGWKFRRTREMNGLVERKLNEVCWILHIDEDDPRDAKVQGMETVFIHEIVKRRRIRLTNQSFPALSWRGDSSKETPETIENDRVLVCRLKYLCFYANAKERALYKWCEKGLHRLQEHECDQRLDNDAKDEELRELWRGHTVPGGAQEGWLPGEREFLRQEDLCHRGIVSRSSLKAPPDMYFPMGDPMKRGSVGSLLTESALQRMSDRATPSISPEDHDLIHKHDAITSDDEVEEVLTSPMLRSQEQRKGRRKSSFNFAGFNGLPIDSSDSDADEVYGMSTLTRGLRRNSIQPRRSRKRSPRIVEIDAQVKTSSSSGTFEKRYEGKITSRYYPTPGSSQRKRPADISFGSPARPTKRVDRRNRVQSSKADLQYKHDGQGSRALLGNRIYFHQEPGPSDSDRTLGRSQSPDSVEEMYTPSRSRAYKATIPGIFTPVSGRKDSALLRSSDTRLPPGMNGLAEYTQRATPSAKTARSSVVNQTQAYGTTEDEGDVVDLTKPQAIPHGSLSGARPSVSRQSGPSKPLYAHSVLSANPDRKSSSRGESVRPTSAHRLFNLNSRLTSIDMRQNPHPISPGSLPMTPRPSQVYRKLSRRSSKAIHSPSSLDTEKPRQQTQSTTIRKPTSKTQQRRYTFGDCFCGTGGMSRGAVSTGLRIKWGFDFNPSACQAYALNFFRTPIYNVWADQFSGARGDHKVDICHLSPPCQFFSDAHTVQGKDDDMNTASLFAIFNLLEKAKPRIVTLEQTSGLIRRHAIFFNAVINMFTSRGFSVRWKVMNCADFGLPQRRTRLFIMAACPGEALPPFPKQTHSSNPEKTGLKPWTTINEAIAKIPAGWANHDIDSAIKRDNSPQSGDKIATCVTTGGGGIIHPSGKRDYTHREFACLQSFPLGHKFSTSGVKKQIGNAVPPTIAQILLESVRDFLLKVDGLL